MASLIRVKAIPKQSRTKTYKAQIIYFSTWFFAGIAQVDELGLARKRRVVLIDLNREIGILKHVGVVVAKSLLTLSQDAQDESYKLLYFPSGWASIMIDTAFRDVSGKIQDLLVESPIADLRGIQVEQMGDQLVLHGRVRTFYAKQMAQETVRRAASDLRIVNSVAVD